MQTTWFFCLLFLIGINLQSMHLPLWPSPQPPPSRVEYVRPHSIKAVTVGDAVKFLYKNSEIVHWDPNSGFAKVLRCLALSSIAVIPFGLAGAGFTCGPNDGYYPICVVSLVGVFAPLGLLATFFFKKTVLHFQHHGADNHNNKLFLKITSELRKNRPFDTELTDEDMAYVGPALIKAESELLKELSPAQALALSWIKPKKWSDLAQDDDTFSATVKPYVDHLLLMQRQNTQDLLQTLENKTTDCYFKAEPSLLQALIRTLPSEVVNDRAVLTALENAFSTMAAGENDNSDIDTPNIISRILHGEPITTFLKRKSPETNQRCFTDVYIHIGPTDSD